MPMVSDELTIESHWQPAKGPYRVGEPILRVLTLKAVGNTLDQLPAIPLPEFPGVRSYDDGGSSSESIQHGKLVAERTVRQAFIPQQQQALGTATHRDPVVGLGHTADPNRASETGDAAH